MSGGLRILYVCVGGCGRCIWSVLVGSTEVTHISRCGQWVLFESGPRPGLLNTLPVCGPTSDLTHYIYISWFTCMVNTQTYLFNSYSQVAALATILRLLTGFKSSEISSTDSQVMLFDHNGLLIKQTLKSDH